MYRILPSAKIFETESSLIVGLGSRQIVCPRDKASLYRDLLQMISTESSENLSEKICSNAAYQEAISVLENAGIIAASTKMLDPMKNVGYKSRLYLGCLQSDHSTIVKKMSNTTVLVIGCGGIGTHIAYSLMSFPIKKLVLIDGDIIDETNLNRQFLFDYEDIGRSKVDALTERIKSLNDDIDVQPEPSFVTVELLRSVLAQVDGPTIAVISADGENLLKQICPELISREIPFLNVGYLNDISVIGPFWTAEEDCCPFCSSALALDELDSSTTSLASFFTTYEAPSCMVNNSFAGAMAVADLINYWTGDKAQIRSINKRIGLVNSTFELLEVPIATDMQCPICSTS